MQKKAEKMNAVKISFNVFGFIKNAIIVNYNLQEKNYKFIYEQKA